MKRMRLIFCLVMALLMIPSLANAQSSLRQQMEWLHQAKKVNFVYDSSLPVDAPYNGPSLKGLSVKKALRMLFDKTEIDYAIHANYIILKRKSQKKSTSYTNHKKVLQAQVRHTLSGYVRDEGGEPLINATVYDLTLGMGTTTNEYGFYYFMDLNAKVTHRFSDRSKIYLSLYHGNDSWNVKETMDDSKADGYQEGQSYYYDKVRTKLVWGNFNAALNWNYLFSPKLFANFTAVYTHNRSKLYSLDDDRCILPSGINASITHLEHSYHSTIDDMGYRAEF